MSNSSRHKRLERYQFPNSRKLWHDRAMHARSLGCQDCHYRETCGGLEVEAAVFDCMSYCQCTDPSKCDNVCPRNVEHFVGRIQEVGGLDLHTVPFVPDPPTLDLPTMVPMVYHNSARSRALDTRFVALSLYEVIDKRTGELRFGTRQSLFDHFKLHSESAIILSGTDHDPPLERWWQLPNREIVIRALTTLGVRLITSPNYSLFDDVPRTDNLYNMKRIAVVTSEIQCEGIPCALHLNARTDRDWDRWIEHFGRHTELRYVAFEFGTGAGAATRMPWYVGQLCRLARETGRPLHLLVRGGLLVLPILSRAFAGVTLIDTASFIKTQQRQRAVLVEGVLSWQKHPTQPGEPLDELMDGNIATVAAYVDAAIAGTVKESQKLVERWQWLSAADDARDETLQPHFLT